MVLLACLLLLAVVLVLPALGGAGAGAQPGAAYGVSWYTVDAGGGTFSTGGGYSLGGTAGQPDAGLLSGGGYTLGGGFWPGGAAAPGPHSRLYLPLVRRRY